jgi:hypothetical protein
MASVGHNIARAIRLQAWLEVIYKNRRGEVTHYWVGIHDIDVGTAKISGDSMHLVKLDCRYLTLRLDSIQAAEVVEGSYYPAGRRMAERLKSDEELLDLLGEDAHIQTLDYLYDCALLNDRAFVDTAIASHECSVLDDSRGCAGRFQHSAYLRGCRYVDVPSDLCT